MGTVETRSTSESMQLFRWGIPGWTLIVAFFIFAFLDTIVVGYKYSIFAYIIEVAKLLGVGTTAFIAGSGVPIGFILYQIYFNFRWNPDFLTADFADDDINKTLTNVQKEELFNDNRNIKEFLKISKEPKWFVMENFLLYLASIEKETASTIYNRSRYLLDVQHTLGSCMLAICVGWIIYLYAKILVLQQYDSFVNSFLISLLALSFLLYIFSMNYCNVRNQIIYIQNYLLRKYSYEIESFLP